jgi:hypothetical protein
VLFQSTSKLWILGAFYLNRNYISNTLCVNRFEAIPICKGQCYLNKELKENEKQEQNFPDLKQKESLLFYQDNEAPGFISFEHQTIDSHTIYKAAIHATTFHTSVFHPPPIA